MTFREVILSIDGLRDKNKVYEAWIRRATFLIGSTNFGGKALANKMNTLWPIEQIDKPKVQNAALEQLAKFREMEALNRANEKLKANG